MRWRQNWLKKGPELVAHVLMVIERWESKVKGTLRWGKLFSQNLETCDVIIPNWLKKTQICISYITGSKNIKIRNYYNFGSKNFFWQMNFWILKHPSSLWRHYSKTGTVRAELISEMPFFTLQKSYFQGYLFLQNTISGSL